MSEVNNNTEEGKPTKPGRDEKGHFIEGNQIGEGRKPVEDDQREIARRIAVNGESADVGVRKNCPAYRIAALRIRMAEKAENHKVIDDLWDQLGGKPNQPSDITLNADPASKILGALANGPRPIQPKAD